jgi:hypothetical protein
MSTETKHIANIPLEITSDCNEVIEHVLSRKPLDPEVYRRVRERSERVTEEIRGKHGILNIAVQLVREARDEE